MPIPKIALIDTGSHRVVSVIEPAHSGMYADGQYYNGYLAKVLPTNYDNPELFGRLHYFADEFGVHDLPEQLYQTWNPHTLQYADAALSQEIKDDAISRVNVCTQAEIYRLYPQWKQANMTARAVELMALGETEGGEWETIKAAWEDIKALRNSSNEQVSAVNAAESTFAIIEILNQ